MTIDEGYNVHQRVNSELCLLAQFPLHHDGPARCQHYNWQSTNLHVPLTLHFPITRKQHPKLLELLKWSTLSLVKMRFINSDGVFLCSVRKIFTFWPFCHQLLLREASKLTITFQTHDPAETNDFCQEVKDQVTARHCSHIQILSVCFFLGSLVVNTF